MKYGCVKDLLNTNGLSIYFFGLLLRPNATATATGEMNILNVTATATGGLKCNCNNNVKKSADIVALHSVSTAEAGEQHRSYRQQCKNIDCGRPPLHMAGAVQAQQNPGSRDTPPSPVAVAVQVPQNPGRLWKASPPRGRCSSGPAETWQAGTVLPPLLLLQFRYHRILAGCGRPPLLVAGAELFIIEPLQIGDQ